MDGSQDSHVNDVIMIIPTLKKSLLAQLVERVTSMTLNDEVSRSSRLEGKYKPYSGSLLLFSPASQ